jgi:hypothetical protein
MCADSTVQLQIFTPSRKIDHLSDEHHMHKYGFLILFCIYSAVVFKLRDTSDALYLKEKPPKPVIA